jgi:hypothetical protein
MNRDATALERAFQLAKSSDYATVEAIKLQLKREGYSTAQVTGGALRAQLAGLIKAARSKSPA